MDKFSILSKTINGIVIFIPKGYVNDLGAENLEHACEEFLSKEMKKVVINFSEIQYINSIGASIFTGIVQKITAAPLQQSLIKSQTLAIAVQLFLI